MRQRSAGILWSSRSDKSARTARKKTETGPSPTPPLRPIYSLDFRLSPGCYRLKDASPEAALRALLGADRKVKLTARVPAVPKRPATDEDIPPLTPEEKTAQQSWTDQQSLLSKLKIIVDDARTYEQDTGVGVL